MRRRVRGFTLLEMLIALAIVAIGLTAALRASGVGIEGVGEYRNHMLALWLAQNIVTERTARQEWPAADTTTSEEEFANHRFVVRQEIKATPNPRFERLDVMIADREEPARTLQHSVAFLILAQ
ncbi:MAG TPA: type II secretion system minor pseudopilin GspI [Thiobacillaceae bacterium]|nr:type II secretion system minor pseudopilin GspI [Thiobacillaceae bacterium]